MLSSVINLLKVKFMQSVCWLGPEILATTWEVQHQESHRHALAEWSAGSWPFAVLFFSYFQSALKVSLEYWWLSNSCS